MPNNGTKLLYNYYNLPKKHWKKYIYASRFIDLVRAKTPKITYYSSLGKSQLMETLSDYELNFYNNYKVIKSLNEGCKIYDNNNKLLINKTIININDINNLYENSNMINIVDNDFNIKILWEHYNNCYEHCLMLNKLLTNMITNEKCFPIIIGRRPNNVNNFKENNMPIFNLQQTPKTPNVSN